MNSLKNLMIMVVLAAVGYGVYVSLARNNVDSPYPPGVAEQWQPGTPSPDMSGATQITSGGSLAIGTGKGPASASSWPSQASNYNPPGSAPDLTPITPYPSSASSAPSYNPKSTLGRPMAGPSSPSAVRNLAPPPGSPVARLDKGPDDGLLQSKFTAFMDEVRKKLDEGKLAEAHLALSTLYGHHDLPAEQARQIVGLLDKLAGTVIYSRRHYLELAYFAKSGETIEQVARQYKVPWQLLARINGLMPPGASNNDEATKDQPLPEGMELKVIRGPFDAVVNLEEQELTLLLQDRYAGRFPIGIGKDQSNIEGVYTVRDKILDPAYYGADGVSFAHDDPKNPLGEAWIGLTDRIGIHGAGDPRDVGRNDNQGSICVGRRDIQDLYGILSVGSRVKVMR